MSIEKFNNQVPLWEKQLLSVKETSELFGIGIKRIYRLIKSNPYADYLITIGNKTTKIKRKAFEEFIKNSSII